MSEYFCISVRFLDAAFHGRGDGGEPEWPPSPLRLFQALVAAAAARWNERRVLDHAGPALRWLETLPAPQIVCPPGTRAGGYQLYVPDNVGDLVGKQWSRGAAGDMASYRTEKGVRATFMEEGGAVHFLWEIAPGTEFAEHQGILSAAARAITHLGWGIDLVAANASTISGDGLRQLAGQRWLPTEEDDGQALRVPTVGTLADLMQRHGAFLGRVRSHGFDGNTPLLAPVPALSIFRLVQYRNAAEPSHRPWAVFELREPREGGFCVFDAVRRQQMVVAMVRHACNRPSFKNRLGWSEEAVARFVLGHAEARGEAHQPVDGPRLLILPLPSIQPRGPGRAQAAEGIRRVLLSVHGTVPGDEFEKVVGALAGAELVPEGRSEPVAILARVVGLDGVVGNYTRSASAWATVTPVILPGYDDPRKLRRRLTAGKDQSLTGKEKNALVLKLDERIDALLRKGIRQAGYPEEWAQHAGIDWNGAGYWPGTDLARQYRVCEQHRRYRRLHVRIRWRDSEGVPINVRGPVCLGGGRFTGLGLFAASADEQ